MNPFPETTPDLPESGSSHKSRTVFTLFPHGSTTVHSVTLGLHSLKEVPESISLVVVQSSSTLRSENLENNSIKGYSENITLRSMEAAQVKSQRLMPVEMTESLQNLLSRSEPLTDSSDQSVVEELLATMPRRFRAQALDRIQDGILEFGKVPVRVGSKILRDISITGIPRPMSCPEPPPEGSDFLLAWKEGALWNWELSPFLKEDSARSQLNITARYINVMRKLAESTEPHLQRIGQTLLSKFPNSEAIDEGFDQSILEAFETGVSFARLVLYQGADNLFNADHGRKSRGPWAEIIRHALSRHGHNIKTDTLLKRLGLQIHPKSGQSKEHWTLRSPWKYAAPPLSLKTFRIRVSEVKKELGHRGPIPSP